MQNTSLDLLFPPVGRKEVAARFDGGSLTSDAGLLLVALADRRIGLTQRLAEQIRDMRQSSKVRHSVLDLIRERVFAISSGYEDCNDLNTMNSDPALLLSCGKGVGSSSVLGSQPTLSRFENSLTVSELMRLGEVLATVVIEQLPAGTTQVVLDIDASEDPCHGQQELELFNKFYDTHCYLPHFLFVTGQDGRQRLLAALLRPGTASAKKGLFGLLRIAIRLLRARFPKVHITLRGDSAYGDGKILSFCDEHRVSFVCGMPTNSRLRDLTQEVKSSVEARAKELGQDVRMFTTFMYKAGSWDAPRRIVCLAETVYGKTNMRYVVTDKLGDTQTVYEYYCGRGDVENRIKEMKLDMSSGRTSCPRFWANQFRLLLHAAAYILMSIIQEAAAGTQLHNAQAGTLRLRLLKIGARVVATTRRIRIHLPTACPMQDVWRHVYWKLTAQT